MVDYEVPTDRYNDEVVTRCAPRWAWAVLDWHIDKRRNSPTVFRNIREEMNKAVWAMNHATENPDLTYVPGMPATEDAS
jgi:hypothetical protein